MPAGTFLPPGLTTSNVKVSGGGTDNYVMTAVDSETIQGEANLQFDSSTLTVIGGVVVGVDDTGHDVKFFGATSGSYMLWDEDADQLLLVASAAGIGATPSDFYADADNLVVGTGSGNNGMTIYAGTSSYSAIYFADGTSGAAQYKGYLSYNHSGDAGFVFGTAGVTSAILSGGSTATLTLGTGAAVDTKLVYNGNAVDYHFGIEDATDTLMIGTASTLGSGTIMAFASTEGRIAIGNNSDAGGGIEPSANIGMYGRWNFGDVGSGNHSAAQLTGYASQVSGANSGSVGGIYAQAVVLAASDENFNKTSSPGLYGLGTYLETQSSSTGVITFAADIFIETGSRSGATITNKYGIYIQDQTIATNDYGLYIAGADTYAIWVAADDSRFDGNVGIGVAPSTGVLEIQRGSNAFSTAAAATDVDNIFLKSNVTQGDGVYGPSIAWARVSDSQRRKLAIVAKQDGADDDDVGMAIFTNPGPGASAMVERLEIGGDGQFDFKTNNIYDVGNAGNEWTARQFKIENEYSGGRNNLTVINDSSDASSSARVAVGMHGGNTTSDVDVQFYRSTGANIYWTMGMDGSNTQAFVISNNDGLGTADALRIATSNGEVTLTLALGDVFDYVCDGCGKSGLEPFECCGTVSWHDDVQALREMTLNNKGIDHMAKLGVLEIDGPDDSEPGWMGINYQKGMQFTWAGMWQNRERMDSQYDEIDKRLDKIEKALGV